MVELGNRQGASVFERGQWDSTSIKQEYAEAGFVGPLEFLSELEAKKWSKVLWQARYRGTGSPLYFNACEIIPGLFELALNRKVLEAVSAVLGPEIVFWGARSFPIRPDRKGRKPQIPWHHETDFPKVLGGKWDVAGTQLYAALDEATAENGTMQVIHGSHRDPRYDVRKFHSNEVLTSSSVRVQRESRKATASIEVEESEIVDLNCKPGQFYLFDWRTVHRTGPSSSSKRLTINARYTSDKEHFSKAMLEHFPEPLRCVTNGDPVNFTPQQFASLRKRNRTKLRHRSRLVGFTDHVLRKAISR